MSNPYAPWSGAYSHSASGPVLQPMDGGSMGRLAPPIFPQTADAQVGASLAQQRAAQEATKNESWRKTETSPQATARGGLANVGNKRFICEVCHMTKPADDESFAEHLESKNHRHMKVLLQNGIWPAGVDGKSTTLKNVHQFEPRVYRMTGNKSRIYCLACQVTCNDATDLLQHQMLPSHSEKVHRLPIRQGPHSGLPLIYYCHICDLVMGKQDRNGEILYQNHLRSEQHKMALANLGKSASTISSLPSGEPVATVNVGNLKEKSTSAWMTEEILMMHQKMKKMVQRYKEAVDEQRSTGRKNPDVPELKNLAESYKAKVEQLVREAQYQYIRKKCAESGTLQESKERGKQSSNAPDMVPLQPEQIHLMQNLTSSSDSAKKSDSLATTSVQGIHSIYGSASSGDPKAGDIARLTAFLKAPGGADSLKVLLGHSPGSTEATPKEESLQRFQQSQMQHPEQSTVTRAEQPGAKVISTLAAAGLLDSDAVLEFLLKGLTGGNESGLSDVQKKMRVYLLEQLVEKRKLSKNNQQTVTDLMMKLSQKPKVEPNRTVVDNIPRQAERMPTRSDMPKEQWESMVSHFLKKTDDKATEELANNLYDGPRIHYVWDGDDPKEKEYVEDRTEFFDELEHEKGYGKDHDTLGNEMISSKEKNSSSRRNRSGRRERSRSRGRYSRSRSRSRHREKTRPKHRSRSRSEERSSRKKVRDHSSKDKGYSRPEHNNSNTTYDYPDRSQELSSNFHELEDQWKQFESLASPKERQTSYGNQEEMEFLKQLAWKEQLGVPDRLDELEQKRLEMHMQSAALRKEAALHEKKMAMESHERRKFGMREVHSGDNLESYLDKLLAVAQFGGASPEKEDEMEIVDPVDEWVERPPEFIKEYEEHPEHRWDTEDLLAASEELARKTESKLGRRQRWDINEGRIDQMRKGRVLPEPKQRIIAPFEIGRTAPRKPVVVQTPVHVSTASLVSALPPPRQPASPGLLESLRGALAHIQKPIPDQSAKIPPLIPRPSGAQMNVDPNLLASAIQQLTGLKAEITVGDIPRQAAPIREPPPRMPPFMHPPRFPPAPPVPPFLRPPPMMPRMPVMNPPRAPTAPVLRHFVVILLPNAVQALAHKFVAVSATLEGSVGAGVPDGTTVFFKPASDVKRKLDISPCCVTVEQALGGLMQFALPVSLNFNMELSDDDYSGMRIGMVWPCKPVNLSEIRMNRPLPAPKVDQVLLQRIGAVEQSLTANEWAELYDWINSVPDIFTVPGFRTADSELDWSMLAWGFYDHPSVQSLSVAQKLQHVLYVLCNASSGLENQWSKKVVHVHVDFDKPGVIKSAIDYRHTSEIEEKLKGAHLGIFEVVLEKLLNASYFSLLKIGSGDVDARVCHMTDPAYCVLGTRILVCSSHFDYHKGHLRNLSFLLRDWGLTVVPEESFFAKRSVSFLGHVFFENTMAPDPEFLNLIDQLPYPEKLDDAVLITNALSHFKHFVSDFMETTKPLKDYKTRGFSKKQVKFRWNVAMQSAVDQLRKELRHAEPLINPDYTKPLVIEVIIKNDGSGGANLLQRLPDGYVGTIERMSRLFSISEMKENKNDQEITLLLWILQKPRVARILKTAKQPCVVYTRQSAVDWLMKTEHAKCSKFDNAKGFFSKQKNLVFRDRSAFFQDYPGAVHASPAVLSPGHAGSSRKDEARPAPSSKDSRRSGKRDHGGRKEEPSKSRKESNTKSQSSHRDEPEKKKHQREGRRGGQHSQKEHKSDKDTNQTSRDSDIEIIHSSISSDQVGREAVLPMAPAAERSVTWNPSGMILPPDEQASVLSFRPSRLSSGRFDVPSSAPGSIDTRLTRINPPTGGRASRWN